MRDWKPRRRLGGTIFCSPACGGNCKRADYDRAVKRSAALAKRLGEGWEPDVWENLGWHFKVTKGLLEVYVHDDHSGRRPKLATSFTAYLQSHPQFWANGPTAEAAIKNTIESAQTTQRRITNAIASLDPRVLR